MLQFRSFGLGLVAQSLTYSFEKGVTLFVPSATIEVPGTGEARFNGGALKVGALLRPRGHAWRFGLTGRGAIPRS